jgi:hypothetical protein
LKPNANLIIWTNTLGKQPIITVCKEYDYHLVGEYLWAKRTSATTPSEMSTKNEVLLRVYESALIFQKDSITSAVKAKPTSSSDTCLPWSVITGYHDLEASQAHPHPCHKPFESLEPLLRAWTRPGDLVLDVFAGSGGILSATARIGGRRMRGIETLDEWARNAEQAVQQQRQAAEGTAKEEEKQLSTKGVPVIPISGDMGAESMKIAANQEDVVDDDDQSPAREADDVAAAVVNKRRAATTAQAPSRDTAASARSTAVRKAVPRAKPVGRK